MKRIVQAAGIGCFVFLAFSALAGSATAATWDVVKQIPLSPGTPQPLGMMHLVNPPNYWGRIYFSNGLDSRVHIVDADNPSTIIPPLYVHDPAVDCSVAPLPDNCPRVGGLTEDYDGLNFLAAATFGDGSKWILVVRPQDGQIMGAIPYPVGLTALLRSIALNFFTGRLDYARDLPKLEAIDRFLGTPLADLLPSHGEPVVSVETDEYDDCYATRVSDSESLFPPAIVQMRLNGQEVGRKLVAPHSSDLAVSLDSNFIPAKLYVWYTDWSMIYGVEGITACNPTSIYSYSVADCEWVSPNTVVRVEWLTIDETGVASFDILRAPSSTGPWSVVATGIPATGPYVSPYLWTDLTPADPGGDWYKVRTNTLAETTPVRPEGRCRF